MRKSFVLALICIVLSAATVSSQTRRRTPTKRSPRSSTAAAQQSTAELDAGRRQIASHIKTLTQFLYLFGSVVKGFETVEHAADCDPPTPAVLDQNARNKTKVRESIRNVRDGLDKLEADFRFKPALSSYFPRLSGVARTAEIAETQAAASRFDEAGKSLLRVIDQLTETLAAMH